MRPVQVISVFLVITMTMLLAGCGSSTKSSSPKGHVKQVKSEPDASSLVPAAVRSKGTLTIATDATYAPNEFIDTDGHTVIGMDADLAKAIGQKLGLKTTVVNASFDSIIPGLASGKYALGMSSFTDSKEREKVVDFVTYFEAGTSFYTGSAGPTINGLADLCGHTVAVERGTVQADDSKAQSKKCTDGGKKAVNVSVFPDQSAANLAITSNRAEVGMADSPVAAYIAKQSQGKLKVTGKPYNSAPYGIAVPKASGMDKAVLAAVKSLMKDGTYNSILTKWNVQAGAINSPVINGATS